MIFKHPSPSPKCCLLALSQEAFFLFTNCPLSANLLLVVKWVDFTAYPGLLSQIFAYKSKQKNPKTKQYAQWQHFFSHILSPGTTVYHFSVRGTSLSAFRSCARFPSMPFSRCNVTPEYKVTLNMLGSSWHHCAAGLHFIPFHKRAECSARGGLNCLPINTIWERQAAEQWPFTRHVFAHSWLTCRTAVNKAE